MKRRIVQVDENKCNGCGACAAACHENAIIMVDGKARLIRDDYCDGLGDCLPACPVDAIQIIEREAAAYDEEAVKKRQEELKKATGENAALDKSAGTLPCGCPGSHAKRLQRAVESAASTDQRPNTEHASTSCIPAYGAGPEPVNRLQQWPVQIKLVPVNAPYFENAKLLIAADCSAYAYANFHERFMKGHITLVGCPKLDSVDYSEKLTAIIRENNIKSVTVVRMEVPCCGGIENAVKTALQNSGKFIPWQVVTLSTDGRILDE